MGEIADMMLDGTLCECCGGYMEGEAPGYPRYCSKQCRLDRIEYVPKPPPPPQTLPKVRCPTCNKKVWRTGLKDHMIAKHGKIKND